jgi:hypothetical protein
MSAKQAALTLVSAMLQLRLAAFTASAQQVPDYRQYLDFQGLPSQSATEYLSKCGDFHPGTPNTTWCLGYLNGIASGLRFAGKACIPDRKWSLDLLDDGLGDSYIKSHPETQQQPAEVVLATLLMQKWPCKDNKG